MERLRTQAGIFLWITLACSAAAQSHSVELLGTIPASQAVHGLGFNLDADQEWQWAAAAEAGATHARVQCPWNVVEQQTAPPANKPATPQYVQAAPCRTAFSFARKYGMQPTVVAAFGPPFHNILTVKLTSPAAAGDTTLQVQLVSGVGGDTLQNLVFPYDYILGPKHQQFTSRHSYQGALMTRAVIRNPNHAIFSLASAVTQPLDVGSVLTVNEILYPSAATGKGDDPSVVAYSNYVMYLAQDMASNGVTGDIELWNEPPWANDPWDNRCVLYDAAFLPSTCAAKGNPPDGTMGTGYPNFGFVANLQNRKFPPGITLTWNGTSGSGASSILSPRMRAVTGVPAKQPNDVVTNESFHPYGNTPEQTIVPFRCVQDAASGNGSFDACELPGEPRGQNLSTATLADLKAKRSNPAFGVHHSVTESGMSPPVPGLDIPKARFIIRQYLALQSNDITPIEYYKFCVPGSASTNYSFVQVTGKSCAAGAYGSYTPTPALKALAGLVSDLKPMVTSSSASMSTRSEDLASVANYSGAYPLSTVHLLRQGERADMLTVWQRSFAPCDAHNKCDVWITQPSPKPGTVTINIPPGMKVSSVMNLTVRFPVPYTTSGRQITFPVADDPIGIVLDQKRQAP